MAIGDGYIDVECDKCGCSEQEPLAIGYLDYSGNNWIYDYKATIDGLEDGGWRIESDGDRCVCPDCCEEEKEGESEDDAE